MKDNATGWKIYNVLLVLLLNCRSSPVYSSCQVCVCGCDLVCYSCTFIFMSNVNKKKMYKRPNIALPHSRWTISFSSTREFVFIYVLSFVLFWRFIALRYRLVFFPGLFIPMRKLGYTRLSFRLQTNTARAHVYRLLRGKRSRSSLLSQNKNKNKT